jgi:hypothetical protein
LGTVHTNQVFDRCYDHNFLRFLKILGVKNGVFLENQCYDQIFAKTRSSLNKNVNFFSKFLGDNIFFKIITSGLQPILCYKDFMPTNRRPGFESRQGTYTYKVF